MNGTENPYKIHEELGEIMTANCTVVRYNDRLKQTDEKILDFEYTLRLLAQTPYLNKLWKAMN